MKFSYKKIMVTSWLPEHMTNQIISNTSGIENKSLYPIVVDDDVIGYACDVNGIDEDGIEIHYINRSGVFYKGTIRLDFPFICVVDYDKYIKLGIHNNPNYREGFIIDNFIGYLKFSISDTKLGCKYNGFTCQLLSSGGKGSYFIGLFDLKTNSKPSESFLVPEDTVEWKQEYYWKLRKHLNEKVNAKELENNLTNEEYDINVIREFDIPLNFKSIIEVVDNNSIIKNLLYYYIKKNRDDVFYSPMQVIPNIVSVLKRINFSEMQDSELIDTHFSYIVKSILVNDINIESLLEVYCYDLVRNYNLVSKYSKEEAEYYLLQSILLIDIIHLVDVMSKGMKYYERGRFLSDLFGEQLFKDSGTTTLELIKYLENITYNDFITDVLSYDGIWRKYDGYIPNPKNRTDVLHLKYPPDKYPDADRFTNLYRSFSAQVYYSYTKETTVFVWAHNLEDSDNEEDIKYMNSWGVYYKITNIDGI